MSFIFNPNCLNAPVNTCNPSRLFSSICASMYADFCFILFSNFGKNTITSINSTNTTIPTKYSPNPINAEIIPTLQSPTEVVSPLNWFLELNKIVFVLIIATPIITAGVISENVPPRLNIYISPSAPDNPASPTKINVFIPALCSLVARSVPAIIDIITHNAILSKHEYVLNSLAQLPNASAIISIPFLPPVYEFPVILQIIPVSKLFFRRVVIRPFFFRLAVLLFRKFRFYSR